MLKLSDRKYRTFLLKDIGFNNYHGKRLVKEKREQGRLPFLTAGENNQGVSEFISNKMNTYKNCFTVDMFGNSFYHNYEFSGDDNIYFFINEKLNHFAVRFICGSVSKCIKGVFTYGKQFRQPNADKLRCMLPVDKKGNPDFDFMEQYIKEREEKKRKEYLEYATKKLEEIKKKAPKTHGGGVITRYKPFVIKEVFKECERGKRLTKEKQTKGNIPYISSTALNNGIDSFIGNEKNVRVFKNSLSLANSGSVGSCFYEPFEFVASDHVTHLKNDKYNKYHYLFLATMLNKLKEKYNFNREISDKRIEREKIMLPEKSGDINLEYCESLIVLMMKKKYHEYIDFAKKYKTE